MLFLRNLSVEVQIHTTMEIKFNMQTEGAFAFLNVKADEPQCDEQRSHVKQSRADPHSRAATCQPELATKPNGDLHSQKPSQCGWA